MNALHQQIGCRLLQDDATSAEAHRTDHIAIVLGCGEHHDARRQRVEIDLFEDRETIFIGHAQTEQKNIGPQLGEKLDAFDAILGFADNGDFLVGIQELS